MAKLELEGNRKERLKQLKKGPGVFVYDGSGVDTEYIPTMLVTKKAEPILKEDGTPVLDGSGRIVNKPIGTPILDDSGRPQLGGDPVVKRISIETYRLWGQSFPKGEPVEVSSPQLAQKLRCMPCFNEVEAGAEAEKPKRLYGSKKKSEPEQSAE